MASLPLHALAAGAVAGLKVQRIRPAPRKWISGRPHTRCGRIQRWCMCVHCAAAPPTSVRPGVAISVGSQRVLVCAQPLRMVSNLSAIVLHGSVSPCARKFCSYVVVISPRALASDRDANFVLPVCMCMSSHENKIDRSRTNKYLLYKIQSFELNATHC